jgi:hypothetical protein
MSCQESLIDLEVIQTDTKTWRFVIKDKNGDPVNITGYKLFFTVKEKLTDLDNVALIQKTVTCPSNDDSVAGIGFISLSSTDTNIPIANYVYDMKIQQNSGLTIVWRKTIATGVFRVNATGTKRVS